MYTNHQCNAENFASSEWEHPGLGPRRIEEPMHGYGIARAIVQRSADVLSFGEGTLYPALKTLVRSGFVQGAWETSAEGSPAKKVYEITPAGREELARIRLAWNEYSRSIDRVLGGRAETQPA